MGLFLHTTKFQFYLSDVWSNMSTYRVIQDFMQKALFF